MLILLPLAILALVLCLEPLFKRPLDKMVDMMTRRF